LSDTLSAANDATFSFVVNKIPDLNRVGYHGGDVEIPTVSTVATIEPNGVADSTERIQAAIDALPASGGALEFGAGDFYVNR